MSKDNFDTLDSQPTIPGEPSGQILSGRYKIVREIGSGGMGTVYLAEDTELDNMQVAVKVLPTILSNNKRSIDNLRREAKTALKLTHPNIVRLHTFQSDEAIKYLVMEYVDGGNLEEKILKAGALNVDDTLKIFTQVAAGLDYAHSQNVLHRDIKPANIMLTKDGKAKLADFGIARQLKDSMTRITGKETSGTLLYMAPEQFRGGEPDHRSDIYSLAASIYECISGHPPFWRGSIEYQIMNEEPAPLEKLNDNQNTVLLRALSKDSKERQSVAKELIDEFNADPAKVDLEAKRSLGDNMADKKLTNVNRKVANKKSGMRLSVTAAALVLIASGSYFGGARYTEYRLKEQFNLTKEQLNLAIEEAGKQEQLLLAELKSVDARRIQGDKELKETTATLIEKMAIIDSLEMQTKLLLKEKTELQNELGKFLQKTGQAVAAPVTVTPIKDTARVAVATEDIDLNGLITSVDLENSLAQISIGTADGVKQNMRFHVIRADKFICDLVILDVESENAIGTLELMELTKQQPKAGDNVSTNL